jgi:UBX domain-containing protein 7
VVLLSENPIKGELANSLIAPGIFNQRPASTVWDDESDSPSRRSNLSRTTGGASESSSKASLLAEMYRPPFELICRLPWDLARQEGREKEKWMIVNVQDPSVFDCQILNRDIWKDPQIKETVREHFLFMQYNKDDRRGREYIQYYFQSHDNQDAYPHIAIVDPRTGEQVKVWSGPPVPKPMEFLMQLHEFLDRYSLKANAKNPVAVRKPVKPKSIDVDRMTEEEMLEMALQNSMTSGILPSGPRDDDPDALTRVSGNIDKGKGRAQEGGSQQYEEDLMDMEPVDTNGHGPISPFMQIPSTKPHVEPAANPTTTTRIQFRHSGGRVIRRFALSDHVMRIYEWLKAEPLEGKAGVEFELVCMGKNLIEVLHSSIEQAGLKNQTVMVEFLED